MSTEAVVSTAGIASVGRPRLISSAGQRAGISGREEILNAAAQLFLEHGYVATTTRMIAVKVGVKQSSLYYHFANKEDILAGLLPATVGPSLTFAKLLARSGEPAQTQLYALTRYDVTVLCSTRWNLAALYGLPELRFERFAEFRRDRTRLANAYARRVQSGVKTGIFEVDSVTAASSLVFALAESVIAMRSDGRAIHPVKFPATTAASVLRMLRCPNGLIIAAAQGYASILESAPSAATFT